MHARLMIFLSLFTNLVNECNEPWNPNDVKTIGIAVANECIERSVFLENVSSVNSHLSNNPKIAETNAEISKTNSVLLILLIRLFENVSKIIAMTETKLIPIIKSKFQNVLIKDAKPWKYAAMSE